MFSQKFLNSFITYKILVLVILISTSLTTDPNSSALVPEEDKSLPIAPKLLGIFADNDNESINILNSHSANSNQAKTKGLIGKGKRIPVQTSQQNIVPVPQNSSQTYSNGSIDRRIDVPELPRVKCKRFDFKNKKVDDNSDDCILGSFKDPFLPTMYDTKIPVGVSEDLEEVFYSRIPDEGDNIDSKSYIAMTVQVCSEPGGRVLIIDEGSNEQLLSFSNFGTGHLCNHFGDDQGDFESFASDSNKVRIEVALPTKSDNDDLDIESNYPDPNGMKIGERKIKSSTFEMKITYHEITFQNNKDFNLYYPDNGTTTKIYDQNSGNSIFTYILNSANNDEDEDVKCKVEKIGINITLDHLDIDIDKGDFLLIGPGSSPTHRELSKAQIISENILTEEDQKKVWVNAEAAYIRLVTHNSQKYDKNQMALRFTWFPRNDSAPDMCEQDVSDQIKNAAIQVCVLEYQCSSFANAMEERFKDELVHLANDFLFNKEPEKDDVNQLISAKSVLIFDKENGLYGQRKDRNQIYCQMSVAITSPYTDQWPLINHNTLHYLFFGNKGQKTMHSFASVIVTDCSHEPISLLKMILPIIIILIVSTALLFAAWRYQYKNWTHSQRAENAKYMNTATVDPNEDVLFAKENPIFIDDDGNVANKRNTSNALHKSSDEIDGRPSIEHKKLRKEVSIERGSTTSSRRLPAVKESPEFVKNLWLSPGTSRQQNEYVFDNGLGRDDNSSASPMTNPDIESYSSADRLSPQTAITGLNGTQHESLRKVYPKSALRPTLSNRTAVSDNEYSVSSPESNPFRRSSKVQFELPNRDNIHDNYSSSEELSD